MQRQDELSPEQRQGGQARKLLLTSAESLKLSAPRFSHL